MRASLLAPPLRLLPLALLLAGCEWVPDVSKYEAKQASDCAAGQKACGYRCVALDDPGAGCAAETCAPCAAGGPNTVPVCNPAACATVCAPGFADCDAAPGCEKAVSADAANCGACGHACPVGVACVNGACDALRTVVPDTGEAPRGLALYQAGIAWANDPAVTGGQTPKGQLNLQPVTSSTPVTPGGAITHLAGVGHPTWLASLGTGRKELAVAGSDPADGGPKAWYVDTGVDAPALAWFGGGQASGAIVGVALTDGFFVSATGPDQDIFEFMSFDTNTTGGASGYGPITGLGSGGGADLVWLGEAGRDPGGVYRFLDAHDGWGPSVVSGGGIYFDLLPAGLQPEAHRITARAGATVDDPFTIWFTDFNDGSVWTGEATGRTTAVPIRLVAGDGTRRTAMDIAADADGVVWSDLDKGEVWAVGNDGQQRRLVAGVRPWAIALTKTEVLFTDVDARRVRAVPR
ncbi:MAG: hypothetical protein U0229_25100 [Anaeromyxobacter sp.]